MDKHVERKFENISQRILNCVEFCLSDFNYIESEVGIDSQKQMHSLCYSIIKSLYDDPTLLRLPTDTDEYYENFMCNNQKPHLIKLYRKAFKRLYELYYFMYLCGIHGELVNGILVVNVSTNGLKVKKDYLFFLLSIGIQMSVEGDILYLKSNKYDNIFPAWILLAKVSLDNNKITSKSIFDFACCVFNKKYEYFIRKTEKAMGLDSGFFEPFINDFRSKDFEIIPDRRFNVNGIEFTYRFMSKDSGFFIAIDYRKKNQFWFGLRNGKGLKKVLEDFDNQEYEVKEFLSKLFNTCRKCNQCTKGKNIKIYAVSIEFNNNKLLLCPLWPNVSWYFINEFMMRNALKIIELQERYIAK